MRRIPTANSYLSGIACPYCYEQDDYNELFGYDIPNGASGNARCTHCGKLMRITLRVEFVAEAIEESEPKE